MYLSSARVGFGNGGGRLCLVSQRAGACLNSRSSRGGRNFNTSGARREQRGRDDYCRNHHSNCSPDCDSVFSAHGSLPSLHYL